MRCRDGASGWRTGAGARRDGLARRDGCLAEARHTGRCVVSDAAGRAPVIFARSAWRVKDAGCVDPVDPVGRPRLLLPCKALRSRGETASPSRQATRASFLGKPFPKGGSTGSIGSTGSTVSASRVHPASTHGPSGIGERPRAAHQSSLSGRWSGNPMLAHVFPSRRLTFLTPRARSAPANARSLSAGDRTGCAHRVYGAWRSASGSSQSPPATPSGRIHCARTPPAPVAVSDRVRQAPGAVRTRSARVRPDWVMAPPEAARAPCPVPRAPCHRTVHGPREDVSGHGRITLGNRGHIGAFAGWDADVERHHEQPAWTPPWDWSTRGTPESRATA